MIAQSYSGSRKKRYSVGHEIGKGGEGAVCEITEDASAVIKVYYDPVSADKSEKLLYMASLADPELLKYAAWPVDVIKDSASTICGFVMKKLTGYVPLHMLFSPKDRKDLFPDKGYNFLIHVAKNLAIAFHKIHQQGIVIGDVNEANILVNSNGMIAFIDCDSFQVKNGSRYHFCEVGVPRYTAPELLERGSFDQVVRTTDTDSFALATLLFQLLFMGRAPFTGKNLTTEDIDEEKAIRTREFAYSLLRNNKKLLPARHSLELSTFPKGIVQAFHAAFEGTTTRPAPKTWAKELDLFLKEIVLCKQSKLHYYLGSLTECPWCRFKRQGTVFFLNDIYSKVIPKLENIDQFVNGFKLERVEIKKLSENYKTATLRPSPIDRTFKIYKYLNLVGAGIIGLASIIYAISSANWPVIFFGLVILGILNSFSPTRTALKNELAKRKEHFTRVKREFLKLVKLHNNNPEINRYNASAVKITELIKTFRRLPEDFDNKKKRIEEKHYNQKYHLYLQRFDIRSYPIPTFGKAKKSLIFNSGIRNAADVSKLNSMKISGIGPKNVQILRDWQRQMGAGFTYIPDFDTIKQEIDTVSSNITASKIRLENDIIVEYKRLVASKTILASTLVTLERQYSDLAIKVYQAELDLGAFSKL